MHTCEYCGETNEKELVFCKKCGANLNYRAVEEHTPEYLKEKNGRTKQKVKKVTKVKKIHEKKKHYNRKKDKEIVYKMSGIQKMIMFFLLLIVVGLASIVGTFVYHNYYARNVKIPNVVGMTIKEAIEVLEENKLYLTKVNKMTTDENEVGIVLEQSPKNGTKSSEKEYVKLMIGVLDQDYLVPNFVGLTMKKVIPLLKEAGIAYEITSYNNTNLSGMDDGIIETQSIAFGKKMRIGDTIVLAVSALSATPTPDMTDLPILPDIKE